MSWMFLVLFLQAQPSNGPKGSISGTIVDLVSGAPIRKAEVKIAGLPGNAAVTDGSGSFLFDQLPAGQYAITATHPDYPQGRNPGSFHMGVQLTAGERRSGLTLKLSPAAALSGHVFDDDGDALLNCTVNLFLNTPQMSVVFRSASTGRGGEYQLRPVPAGKYYLEARCPEPVLQPRPYLPAHVAAPGPKLGFSQRFYPGTRDFSGAQRLNIAAGQVLNGLDFRMTPEPVSSLTVHIAGTAGARVTAALAPDDHGPQRPSDTIAGSLSGKGEIHFSSIPANRYVLRINSTTPEHLLLTKQVVTVGEDPVEITVQVQPPVPLSGTLQLGESKEPAPTRISLYQIGEMDVHLSAELKPDGTFTFRGVSPGRYRIMNLGNNWVTSVSIAGDRTEGPEFELKAGASGPLQITAGSDRGGISGDIDLGSAHPAKIAVIATFGYVQTEIPDATVVPPRYSAKLPPGEYRLYAVEVVPGGDLFRLLDYESLIGRGELVNVGANSQTGKTLRLITAEEIAQADR